VVAQQERREAGGLGSARGLQQAFGRLGVLGDDAEAEWLQGR